MQSPDELGVLAEYYRNSIIESLNSILWEIVANRRHNADKSTAKFLFMKFGSYFILGYNHYRSQESIEKEHTPFKFNDSKKEATASISTRGYGAKLFPFHIRGKYCNIARISDSPTFTTEMKEWLMKEWIDMDELARIIDSDEKAEFQPAQFRSQYWVPMTKKPGRTREMPFFCEEEFSRSPLAEFVMEHNFKYFYVFVDVNPSVITGLRSTLNTLARIHENADVEIYSSFNYEAPVRAVSGVGFGLLPKDWIGAAVFDWRLGEKMRKEGPTGVNHFYKSEFRLQFQGADKVYWGRNDSNGSAGPQFAKRFASFVPPTDVEWKPQVRITLAVASAAHASTIDVGEKLAEHIYLRMEDDLISFREADPRIASKLRNLKAPSRIRLIVDIIEESMKTNTEAGLVTSGVKSKSHIAGAGDKGIHEMMEQSLSLFRKHLAKVFETALTDEDAATAFVAEGRLKEMEGHINKNLAASSRSTKRKREGLVFESMVGKYLRGAFEDIEISGVSIETEWEESDATIAANHELTGQAIDTLGVLRLPDRNIWIAIQSKDRECAVPKKELDAFVSCVAELREKKAADKVIAVLSLAKSKTFNYATYKYMLKNNIMTVVEDGDVGKASEVAIVRMLENIL